MLLSKVAIGGFEHFVNTKATLCSVPGPGTFSWTREEYLCLLQEQHNVFLTTSFRRPSSVLRCSQLLKINTKCIHNECKCPKRQS